VLAETDSVLPTFDDDRALGANALGFVLTAQTVQPPLAVQMKEEIGVDVAAAG
jgi:hypothetical protein